MAVPGKPQPAGCLLLFGYWIVQTFLGASLPFRVHAYENIIVTVRCLRHGHVPLAVPGLSAILYGFPPTAVRRIHETHATAAHPNPTYSSLVTQPYS